MSDSPTVIALGSHILDTLVRPVEAIPDGQGGELVEQIAMTAAGPAGGTALVLSKLGCTVRSAGAIGTDHLGDFLLTLLQRDGVDTSLLVRRDGVQTSASVLPIRADGSRPALHVIGANGAYDIDDVPWDAIAAADHLHVGGPEFLGDTAVKVLSFAHENGVPTSVDSVIPGDPGFFAMISAVLPHVDYLLPNDEQALGWTGTTDLADAGRTLVDLGVGCAAITAGADGAVVVTDEGVETVPAFDIVPVDTTGCGDSFSAGFIRALRLGRTPAQAAVLGCATAAQVAAGLGTDFGDFDLATVEAFATTTPTRST